MNAFDRGFVKEAEKYNGGNAPGYGNFLHTKGLTPKQQAALDRIAKDQANYRADFAKKLTEGATDYGVEIGDSTNFRDDILSTFLDKYQGADAFPGSGLLRITPQKKKDRINSQAVIVSDLTKAAPKSEAYLEEEKKKYQDKWFLRRWLSKKPTEDNLLDFLSPEQNEELHKLYNYKYYVAGNPLADKKLLKKTYPEGSYIA
jgi:hypothetical protein